MYEVWDAVVRTAMHMGTELHDYTVSFLGLALLLLPSLLGLLFHRLEAFLLLPFGKLLAPLGLHVMRLLVFLGLQLLGQFEAGINRN